VDASGLQKLGSVVMEPGISLRLMTDGTQLDQMVEFVRAGDAGQYGDKAFVEELIRWIRFDEGEALQHHDGLFTRTSGNPSLPRWLGEFIVSNFSAGSQVQTDETNMRSSSGMALLVSERNDKQGWVETGRVHERLALTATALGIKSAFMNQPVEVQELRSQLQSHLKLGSAYPQLLMRFGYSQAMPRSLRRPIQDVMT